MRDRDDQNRHPVVMQGVDHAPADTKVVFAAALQRLQTGGGSGIGGKPVPASQHLLLHRPVWLQQFRPPMNETRPAKSRSSGQVDAKVTSDILDWHTHRPHFRLPLRNRLCRQSGQIGVPRLVAFLKGAEIMKRHDRGRRVPVAGQHNALLGLLTMLDRIRHGAWQRFRWQRDACGGGHSGSFAPKYGFLAGRCERNVRNGDRRLTLWKQWRPRRDSNPRPQD